MLADAADPWIFAGAGVTLGVRAPTRRTVPGDEVGEGPLAVREGEHRMSGKETHRTATAPPGRRALAALAGLAAATALLAGCGGAREAEPASPSADEATSTAATTSPAGTATDSATDDPATDDGATDPATDDPTTDPVTRDPDSDHAIGEELFEGTWGFGHDEKVLDADQLAAVLQREALSRGPEGMSLEVRCEDGVDTSIPDYEADCTAYADEGVAHAWHVTVGPADAGIGGEVENVPGGDETGGGETDGDDTAAGVLDGPSEPQGLTGLNFFRGTWDVATDHTSLDPASLGDLLTEHVGQHGPQDVNIVVTCTDAVDLYTADLEADCTAVEVGSARHPWHVTIDAAGEGIEIYVENLG